MFAELSEEAKQKAIEQHRYFNVEYGEWWDSVYEGFRETLKEYGYFEPSDILFSGFNSQGDGACFEGTFDLKKWVEDNYKGTRFAKICEAYARNKVGIAKNLWFNQYCHERTRYIDAGDVFEDLKDGMPYGHWPNLEAYLYAICDKIADEATQEYRTLCKQLYKDLKAAYEDLTSDEAVSESLEANEYEFTENGEQI